jgi:CheY-specific phosphatase CheX
MAQATLDTLGKAFGRVVQPGRAALKRTDLPLGDLTSVIEILGDSFHASMAVAYNEQCILSFTQLLIHETFTSINDTVESIANDVTVMIGGSVVRRFAQMGHVLRLKHPKVYCGYSTRIVHTVAAPKIVFPINSEDGIVFLEVCMKVFPPRQKRVTPSSIAA